jgi:hypothetical protein
MLTIEPASPADVEALAARLHADDAAELDAAGVELHKALASVPCRALRWHGDLVALFGLLPPSMVTPCSVPWMLCTTVLNQVPRRSMAAISQQVVAGWKAESTAMANLVHRHNARALRFLRFLGFTVDADPVGPGGQFFYFHWSR